MQQSVQVPANQQKPDREEMWLIILIKSKIMRVFSVSCELVLFLGCLWLTMTTVLPSASAWVSGGIDNFFLVAMGFAVDAAMPEAWLHVVDQWTDTPRKKMHLRWSISIAIGMSLLVVANVTYSKIAGTSGETPTGGMEALVNTLLIARILIGISYVAIRECQSFLDRKQAKQQPAQPALPDFQAMISNAIERVTSEQAKVNQHLLAALEEVKTTVVPVDMGALTDAVSNRLREQIEVFLNERVTVSPVFETPQIPASVSNKNSVSKQPARSKKNSNVEIVKRSRRVSDEEVDAVVHPILDKDPSLTHRKIAPVVDLPETTVYNSVKRYRSTHNTTVSGDVETSVSDNAVM